MGDMTTIEIARDVRRRRKALGMTILQLDAACGFERRTVERVERSAGDHRGLAPGDDRIGTVFETLDTLEVNPPELPDKPGGYGRPYQRRRPVLVEREPRPDASHEAKVIRCPDVGCWMTQAGCEARLGSAPACRSLRGGRGCRGVKYRTRLERKNITVEYVAPREAAQ